MNPALDYSLRHCEGDTVRAIGKLLLEGVLMDGEKYKSPESRPYRKVAKGTVEMESQSGQRQIEWKRLVLVLLILYGTYAAVHFLDGISKQCSLRSIIITAFPVRDLYLIPQVERLWSIGMAEGFREGDAATGLIGSVFAEAIKKPIVDLIRSADCLTLQLWGKRLGDVFGEDPPAIGTTAVKPGSTPIPTPFQRYFHERKYGRLTAEGVPIFAGISEHAKQKGTCTNPGVLIVEVEHRDHYRIRCAGKQGYIDQDLIRMISGPPAARLRSQAAFLYALPKLSSKQSAICYQPDIRFVEEQVGDFFRVRCDGKKGWVEAKNIQILN